MSRVKQAKGEGREKGSGQKLQRPRGGNREQGDAGEADGVDQARFLRPC